MVMEMAENFIMRDLEQGEDLISWRGGRRPANVREALVFGRVEDWGCVEIMGTNRDRSATGVRVQRTLFLGQRCKIRTGETTRQK